MHASLWVYVSLARLQEPLWKLGEVVSFSLCRSHRLLCAGLPLSTDTHPFLFSTACQCNGHSKCINESICEKCENLTTGKHCETCISGYYGDPTNGGTCQRKWCLNSSFAECYGVLLLFTHSSSILTEIISQWYISFLQARHHPCFFASKMQKWLDEVLWLVLHKIKMIFPSFVHFKWPHWKMS